MSCAAFQKASTLVFTALAGDKTAIRYVKRELEQLGLSDRQEPFQFQSFALPGSAPQDRVLSGEELGAGRCRDSHDSGILEFSFD